MYSILSTFRSPGAEFFQLGPLIFRWYGILIAISLLIGLNLSNSLGKFRNISDGFINDLMPVLVLSAIAGARIYYVIFEWRNYSGINFWSTINIFGIGISIPTFLEIWEGGIAIHGALIFGALSVMLFC